ncbi:MAG: hypothetical protein IPO15_26935 [Anaerolineae bacterium]|uniref:hypothetical protein n=1 Tax=Candidatus Amarolinea dominans TaxID=3140696 RepID=UPI003134B138|nr:hypothetical protein [Anaerolineae bacterium]
MRPLARKRSRATFNPVTGQVWVVWQDYPNPPPRLIRGRPTLRLARLAPDGAVQATTIVSQVAPWPVPDVACSSSGNCDVIWGDSGGNGGVWLALWTRPVSCARRRVASAPCRPMTRVSRPATQRLSWPFANSGYIYVSTWTE